MRKMHAYSSYEKGHTLKFKANLQEAKEQKPLPDSSKPPPPPKVFGQGIVCRTVFLYIEQLLFLRKTFISSRIFSYFACLVYLALSETSLTCLQVINNPFPNKPWFLHACSISLLKTLGKGEIACDKQFLLYPQCFLPVWRTFHHFH